MPIDPTYVDFLREFGFPTIAFFLMYKLVTDTIAKNTEAIGELTAMISLRK